MDQTQVNQTYEVFSKLQFVSGTCAEAEHIKLTRQNNNNKKQQKTRNVCFGRLKFKLFLLDHHPYSLRVGLLFELCLLQR